MDSSLLSAIIDINCVCKYRNWTLKKVDTVSFAALCRLSFKAADLCNNVRGCVCVCFVTSVYDLHDDDDNNNNNEITRRGRCFLLSLIFMPAALCWWANKK